MAQECSQPGQTPSTAFPVCGTSVFEQKQVPICGNRTVYVPGCSGPGSVLYQNKNPYWYKFTCYESGTLGFVIKPKDATDDYDWQLYDITGLSPEAVFTNREIVVTGNWAGNPGNTGTSATGAPYIQCASPYDGNEPRFARMPELIAGREYLLMVSHFTETQSGYDLSFEGGTAVITDPLKPKMLSLNNSCDASTIYIKTNKRIKCSSVAMDGSDFSIPGIGVNIVSASPACSGFDTDSIILKLDGPLPPGDYDVVVKEGTDGNTLLDNCDNFVPENDALSLRILPLLPTPMDNLQPVQCAPGELTLLFGKRMRCASVSADGSDFEVLGPSPVAISGIKMNCDDEGMSSSITLLLSEPISVGGNYRIRLKRGTDGDAIVDECGQETPVNSFVPFHLKDTVSADFTYGVISDCKKSTIQFSHDGNHGVDSWKWQLDYQGTSEIKNPSASFTPFGIKNIRLVVSNGFCSDTLLKVIDLGPRLVANFESEPIICPEDSLIVVNKSTGNIVSHLWLFGDGDSSDEPVPVSKKYTVWPTERDYKLSLIVRSDIGCADTLTRDLKVLMSCNIEVPNAFTPNGDNVNDYFYPLNAIKADDYLFRVYNRAGKLLFESRDWKSKWDGTFKGEPQNAGVYAWTLQYRHRDTGKEVSQKGSVTLIR